MESLQWSDLAKQELIRLILTRAQQMDLSSFSPAAPDWDDVEETLNIPYMNREEKPLGMDVFRPKVPAGTELPVVVTIHGGGLTLGDRRISRPFSRYLAHRGYLVFSIEYRLVPQANMCQELDDVCAGLDLIGTMLVNYDVDFTRVFIAAESAGAFLAAYVTAMHSSKKLQEAIGYQPGRLTFRAIGLISGMLYTTLNDPCGKILSAQIYGEKRLDGNFLQYMNPEHPEILQNLPPVYLITSRGDFVNHYSIMFHDALKKAGRPCRLLYYGDPKLQHAFPNLQPDEPGSMEAVDKMLAWFEQQADARRKAEKAAEKAALKKADQEKRMADGSMDDQPVWSYVRERAEADPDRLSAPAIIDCTKTWTYGQMFDAWDRYARVFSALGMTGAGRARVGIAGAITAEPLFAFYALNMTGAECSMLSYPDFLPGGRWKTMVEKEHITDLFLTDIMVTPQLWEELRQAQKALGLRNIILVHSRMGGPCVGPAELTYNEFNFRALKRCPDIVFMDDLLAKYADVPIVFGEKGGDSIAVITHTSGSTKGTRKPLPYTSRSINAAASSQPLGLKSVFPDRFEDVVRERVTMTFDLSSYMNISGQANMNLCAGNTVVLTFFGFMHPKFVKAIDYYKLNEILLTSFQLDSWIAMPDIDQVDFSSLKMICLGGSYIPPAKVRTYIDFLKKQGFPYEITRGYGMSEIGGAQLYIPKECDEDILGYPMPPQDFYVLDDDDGQFHCVTEGERTGVMYVTSSSMCLNVLDGEELFPLTEIGGRQFVCTNDAVHVNADTSLTYAGRMDKFFVNNDGIRFESGLVETLINGLSCVGQMTIVPILDKRIHDSVPVLFIRPTGPDADCADAVADRLAQIYREEPRLIGTVLPSQLVLVDTFPSTASGKIDSYRLSRQRATGRAYDIVPVYRKDGSLTSVNCRLTEEISSFKAGALPKGMDGASALGLFEAFNTGAASAPSLSDDLLLLGRFLKQQAEDRKEFRKVLRTGAPDLTGLLPDRKDMKLPQLPDRLTERLMDLQGLLYRQDTIGYDFED